MLTTAMDLVTTLRRWQQLQPQEPPRRRRPVPPESVLYPVLVVAPPPLQTMEWRARHQMTGLQGHS
jgi:hypothetical protein